MIKKIRTLIVSTDLWNDVSNGNNIQSNWFDEFDAELKKDMDAGENPTTKTVAPGNIKNDSTDEKDQK